jgi:hypothetical protein
VGGVEKGRGLDKRETDRRREEVWQKREEREER